MAILYKALDFGSPSEVVNDDELGMRRRIRDRILEREARRQLPPSPLRRTVRGDVMRAWRVALDMTQRETAALLMVTVRTVKRIEATEPTVPASSPTPPPTSL